MIGSSERGYKAIVIFFLQHMIGSSERGYKDGSFQEAMFSSPQGVVICDTRIFVADTDNHVIRMVCAVNNLNVISSLTWVQTVCKVQHPR